MVDQRGVHREDNQPGATGRELRFRADIETLRAISVLAVVFYHARWPGFSGGYVGVDIFFVISGFLITGLLLRETGKSGTIDVLAFWARRAWRLLPNALAALLATFVLAIILLPADRHVLIGKDIASAIFYFANYRFASRSVDYFDEAVSTSPVLHFWSLSVEEQFYFIWPFFILGIAWRWGSQGKRALSIAVSVVLVASFILSLIWMARSQPNAFFGTDARVWQLSLGALLAVQSQRFHDLSQLTRQLLVIAGLCGIIACIVLFDDHMIYPGWGALLPVTAAALVIAGGTGARSLPKGLFEFAPLQWIGKRSYSLYLWHWPILMFFGLNASSSLTSHFLAIATVFLVATLAFALIEDPLRHAFEPRLLPPQRLGIASVSSLAAGLLVLGPSWSDRFYPGEQAALIARIKAAKSDRPRFPTRTCHPGWAESAKPTCRYGDREAKRTVILFGDSYAKHLFGGLDEAARASKWSLQVWTRNSCPPLLAPVWDGQKRRTDEECMTWRNQAIARMIRLRPQLVVISSWSGMARKMFDPVTGRKLGKADAMQRWQSGFSALLEKLTKAGLDVAIVRSTPRGSFVNLMSCLRAGLRDGCGRPRLRALEMSPPPDLEIAAKFPAIHTLDLSSKFCGPNTCYSVRNGVIVYSDHAHHITTKFARTLKPEFQSLLAKVKSR